MKKLFLTSITENVLNNFPLLIGKKPEETKVAFIPTAADPYEDKSFVKTDKEKWLDLSYDLKEVDLKNKDQEDLRREFYDRDVIYLSGGNVFYLLQEAKKCGLKNVIKDCFGKGKIYAGASAGAAITGPSIEILKTIDDPSEASKLENFTAFNFVDFIILPHFNYGKYREKYKKIINEYDRFELEPLDNNEAIFVDGNKISKIS